MFGLPRWAGTEELKEHHRQVDLAFYPISPEGMLLFVWPEPKDVTDAVKPATTFIPYGYMLVMRGMVTHAGGVQTPGGKLGNPRVHLYVEKEGGYALGGQTQNYYHSDGGELYRHPEGWEAEATKMIQSLNEK